MLIKQISVFVENRRGSLYEITDVLANAKVDIRALTIADTTDFGILRLIVSEPDKAFQALKKFGFTVSITNVVGLKLNDQPGGFSAALKIMDAANLSVEYTYAFISHSSSNAHVIMRVNEPEQAIAVLQEKGFHFLAEDENYSK